MRPHPQLLLGPRQVEREEREKGVGEKENEGEEKQEN